MAARNVRFRAQRRCPRILQLHKFTPQRPQSAQFSIARLMKSTIFQLHTVGTHFANKPSGAGSDDERVPN
jgi:hypothetical protein